MADRRSPELKSANRAAYEHYLRTGQRLTVEEWLGLNERKFNPYHDPDDGRFTFKPGNGSLAPRARLSANNRPGSPTSARPSSAARQSSPAVSSRTQPAAPPRDPDSAAKQQRDIGALAAKYESRKLEGPGTVSSGRGDPGGVSYGTFQMSSNAKVVHNFVNSPEARAWAVRFHGKTPVTKAFDDEWRAIAAADPEAFESAQRAYIVRANYSPGASEVRRKTRYELDRSSAAVRQVFFATVVQHGPSGGGGLFVEAVQITDEKLKRDDPRYEPALINSLYDRRTEQRLTFARRARARAAMLMSNRRPGEAADWLRKARQAENDANRRYPRERYDALLLLSGQSLSNL